MAAQRRSSFAYVVMRPDERVQLGCVYIVPSEKQGFDAAALWVRASEVPGDLDEVRYALPRSRVSAVPGACQLPVSGRPRSVSARPDSRPLPAASTWPT
jgi:hypothetical protein